MDLTNPGLFSNKTPAINKEPLAKRLEKADSSTVSAADEQKQTFQGFELKVGGKT